MVIRLGRRSIARTLWLLIIASGCLTISYDILHQGKSVQKSLRNATWLDTGQSQIHYAVNATPRRSPEPQHRHRDSSSADGLLEKSLYHFPGLALYIRSAFRDDRFKGQIVRILAVQHKDANLPQFSCRTSDPVTGEVLRVAAPKVFIDVSWPLYSLYFACLFDCHFPDSISPSTIEFVSHDEEYSLEIPVRQPVKRKEPKTLAICLKPITGTFKVSRLVEWFELHLAVGVEHFLVFNGDMHGPVQFTLEYYRQKGHVELLNFPFLYSFFTYAEEVPGMLTAAERYAAYQQVYLVALQECLYSFYGSYDNLLYIDLDEILLPTSNKSLVDITKDLRRDYYAGAGFMFHTAWHFEDLGAITDEGIPDYLYAQRYGKATPPQEVQPKSIVRTDRTLTVNFHAVRDVPDRKYSNEIIPVEIGYVHHYRGMCRSKFDAKQCQDLMHNIRIDENVKRYRDLMKVKVKHVLDILQLN